MEIPFYQIVTGIGAGITYATTGFGKNAGQEMDWVKFFSTVGLGAIVGIIYTVTGTPFDIGMSYITQLGIVPILENVIKTVLRRLFGKKTTKK